MFNCCNDYTVLSECTVGWSELAFFSIFENQYLSIMYSSNSQKIGSIGRVSHEQPSSLIQTIKETTLKLIFFYLNLAKPSLYCTVHQRTIAKKKIWNLIFCYFPKIGKIVFDLYKRTLPACLASVVYNLSWGHGVSTEGVSFKTKRWRDSNVTSTSSQRLQTLRWR